MYGRDLKVIGKKGTICTGLFLCMWLVFSGCVKPTPGPGATNTPVPVATGDVKPTTGPTTEPVAGTQVPQVTEPVTAPTVTPVAGPTDVPEMTPPVMVTPAEGPETTPVITPGTPTPGVPEEDVTEDPVLTPEVSPELSPTPVPLPTAVPEYDTLLQNGWQRTEDFFGCREIFFSGKFDDAEPVVGDDGYEFSYRAVSDVSVLLRIIGEENRGVSMFLEELQRSYPDCLTVQEGPDDYSYVYIDGKTQVTGRVYACGDEENGNRMRVEFYSPAGSDVQTEGYGFYLR